MCRWEGNTHRNNMTQSTGNIGNYYCTILNGKLYEIQQKPYEPLDIFIKKVDFFTSAMTAAGKGIEFAIAMSLCNAYANKLLYCVSYGEELEQRISEIELNMK